MATALSLPFTINGTVYNDGDYIYLSTPQITATSPPVDDVFTGYNVPATTTLGDLYLSSGPYSLAANTPPIKTAYYVSYAVNNAHTTYSQFDVYRPSLTPSMYTQDLGVTTMVSDATMMPNQCLFLERERLQYIGTVPDKGQVSPMQHDYQVTQNNVPVNNDFRLCLEFHPGNYVAIRSVNGLYLHVTNTYDINSTYRSPANKSPQNLVATFSNLPSAMFTAQYKVYSQGNGIALQNRATGTYISLGTGLQSWSQIRYYCNAFGAFNYITKTAATTYDNVYDNSERCEWWDLYTQPYWRVTGNSTTAVPFNIIKPTQTCDPSINPTNSVCISKLSNNQDTNSLVANALMNFCSNGDLPTTNNCQSWIVGQKSNVSALITNYCSTNPNDLTLCACVNTWPYRGLMDYISLSTDPVGLIPKCNIVNCASNTSSCWHPTTEPSCDQQVCVQGLSIGSVISSDIKVDQKCVFQSDGNINPSPDPPSTGQQFDFTALFASILAYYQTLTLMQIVLGVIILVLVAVVLIALKVDVIGSIIVAILISGASVFFNVSQFIKL